MLASIVLIYIVTIFSAMFAVHTMPCQNPTVEIVAPIPGAIFAPTLTIAPMIKIDGANRHPLSGVKGADWSAVWAGRKALGLPGVNRPADPMADFMRRAPQPQSRMQWNPLTRSYC